VDLIGRVVDVLPQPRGMAPRGDPEPAPGPVTIVSVIEPDAGQLVGAVMLWLSLGQSPTPHVYRLCIVERSPRAAELLEACSELGLSAGSAASRHANPFLNKWLIFDAFSGLREAGQVALLDWDMLLCAQSPLPGPGGAAIAARRNRSGMYRDLLASTVEPLPRSPALLWGRVRSSINGGVLVGSGASLQEVAERTTSWFAEISRRVPAEPVWKQDQLAVSIAVGEVGLTPLDRRWNVTPQSHSSVADRDVCLWHYNDGVEATRQLKRCLRDPARARQQLSHLAARWPRTVAAFSARYDEALALGPLRRLLQRGP
jgi:hypothetical protein